MLAERRQTVTHPELNQLASLLCPKVGLFSVPETVLTQLRTLLMIET